MCVCFCECALGGGGRRAPTTHSVTRVSYRADNVNVMCHSQTTWGTGEMQHISRGMPAAEHFHYSQLELLHYWSHTHPRSLMALLLFSVAGLFFPFHV